MGAERSGDESWVDNVALQFDQAWKSGSQPRIEDYLAGVAEPRRGLLLEELVRVELQRRRGRGEDPGPSEYHGRFPGDASVIDAALEAPAGSPGPTPTPTSSSRRAGKRFRILRFHKQGGLGQIYVAYDEELGREVALKEIRPDKAAEAVLRSRFVLEAEINGGLEHPGIVPVYSLGTYDDGLPFYAMRFVEGDNLKEAIESYHKEHPRPDPTAGEFRKLLGRFVQVCQAIAFAHSKGVLHRDLKPHNVMLGRYGETLLIDWGLAKATGHGEPAGSQAAREKTLAPPSGSGHAPTLGVLGSPAFMSPEQAALAFVTAGDSLELKEAMESLGPATDVYGLGAMLFALLTGEPPVEGKTTTEILDQARRGAIRPPRSVNPNIPGALEAVCLKALAPKPGDRYATAQALAEEVERWLADEPVTAWREPFALQARRWVRRNRTAVTTAAVALVAGVVGLSALAAVQSKANRDLKREKDNTTRALVAETKAKNDTQEALTQKGEALAQSEEARKRAEAVLGFLKDDVLAAARPEGKDGGLGVAVTVRQAVDAAEPRIAERFKDQPIVEAEIRHTLGTTYWYLREASLAIRQIERALDLLQTRLGPEHPDTLASRNNLATAYLDAGRTADAIKMYEATLKQRELKLGTDHPDTLTSRNNVAVAYLAAGRAADAIKMHEAALKQRESKLGPDHPDTLVTRNNLARAYLEAGRTADAIKMHEATLKVFESKLGPDHPTTLTSRNNLALAYHAAGRTADAIKMYEATLKQRESKLGTDHPDTLASRNNLATAYRAAGRTVDAIKMHEATLKLLQSKLGPDHPDTLVSRNNVAFGYQSAGRTADAIKIFEATLKLCESKLGPDHPNTLISRGNLAKAYRAAGQLDRAVSLLQQTLQGFRAKVGPDHPYTLTTEQFLADAYTAAGKYTGAELLLRDGLERARTRFGPSDPRTALAMAQLGLNLIQQRKWSEAELVLRECLAIREKAQPDDWSTFNTRSLLGDSLLGQKKFADAEPLILVGYEGMKAREAKIPAPGKPFLAEAAARVVRLYEACHRPAQAAEWKRKLGLSDLPADVFARP